MSKEKSKCKVSKEKRALNCILSDEEQKERALSLASTKIEIDRLEAEAAAIAKDYKDQVKGLESELRKLAQTVKKGEELRQVDVDVVLDYVDVVYYLIRKDTGEMFDRRPMTDYEKQIQI